MSYCLNPQCPQPKNPENNKFCQNCGQKLLLKERYLAIKPIGKGGFGRTFLAADLGQTGSLRCVIKQFFPREPDSQKAAELFAQEAVRLKELDGHPQIPRLLGYFSQSDRQYLVQEFIAGENLAQVLKDEGNFNEATIYELLINLIPVLEFIHSHNIIHRDIKPENIIRSADGKLILVDFGAAKFASGTALLKTGTSIGTAEFVAPEQARGKAVFASDIYSLGVTCIYLLTGISPFDLLDSNENKWVWRDYLADNPVSDRLAAILDKAIAAALKDRYQSATAVWQSLNPVRTIPLSKPRVSGTKANLLHCIATFSHRDPIFAGVRAIAISPDSQLIASASEDCTVKLWDVQHQEEVFTLRGNSGFVNVVTFSRDGKIAISGDYNGTIKLWDVAAGSEILTVTPEADIIYALALSPNGKILASGCNKFIHLWEFPSGKLIRYINYWDKFNALAFSQDGKFLISGVGSLIKIWNVQNGAEISSLYGHVGTINTVAISPDGQTLASGDNINEIKLWNLQRPTQPARSLSGHAGWFHNGLNCLAFSPDGKTLASAAGDRTIKLWHMPGGKLIATLSAHAKGTTSVAFSPNGQFLASGSMDKTIKIWRI